MLLDLFTEPDIFNIKWDALTQYNGIIYPALPDLYGPTMNVSSPSLPALTIGWLRSSCCSGLLEPKFHGGLM